MRIAVDVMGGDYAPLEIVAGAKEAAHNFPELELILVGDEQAILATKISLPVNVSIKHTKEFITMDEAPVLAIRKSQKPP